ncbi:MAG: DUF1028 domain-containing protein, partial [Acidobacteriota bacterium]|nr:DUF1028 domain-containing protein [Acidobacteriota bacterium]
MNQTRLRRFGLVLAVCCLVTMLFNHTISAQEPKDWGDDLVFHTFSIAAVDPSTGESGVAVTTRVPCVGNGVPWVRAGVGAVATQASTRTAYGAELLDMLEQGMSPADALATAVASDPVANRRQVGVVALDGSAAQHTGDGTSSWAGHRSGINYAVQGNTLVGPEVVEAVADNFESTEGSVRHLADRLIESLTAGQVMGGDSRVGRLQSAAVIVADPREGRSRRADGMTVQINVCEHPTPVAELRRVYNTISRTLGYRSLQQYSGPDIWQLKVILHALGYYRAEESTLEVGDEAQLYTNEAVEAINAFRTDQGVATVLRGFVDPQTVELLWQQLEMRGIADQIRMDLLETT